MQAGCTTGARAAAREHLLPEAGALQEAVMCTAGRFWKGLSGIAKQEGPQKKAAAGHEFHEAGEKLRK